MTRTKTKGTQTPARTGQWALQDAKARFSEVVRKAKTEGPQRITVHGREEVVVVSVEEYRRGKGHLTGEALVKVLQESPAGDISMDRVRTRSRVRPVEL
jgi:prevent-host-death family protein